MELNIYFDYDLKNVDEIKIEIERLEYEIDEIKQMILLYGVGRPKDFASDNQSPAMVVYDDLNELMESFQLKVSKLKELYIILDNFDN